jgi:putative aminopeptidase FrvX
LGLTKPARHYSATFAQFAKFPAKTHGQLVLAHLYNASMTTPLPIDIDELLDFMVPLLNTPSPTGWTEAAIALCAERFTRFGAPARTRKGALVLTLPGRADDAPRGVTAHVDTLGAMVKEIKTNGRLKLTKIGGFAWNTIEGEGCTVFTHAGGTVRGSLLLNPGLEPHLRRGDRRCQTRR